MSKEPNNAAKGKRDNQKMKPFFVMEYLLKNSDENKRITADKIRDALLEKYDISSIEDEETQDIYLQKLSEINLAYTTLIKSLIFKK